LNDAQSMKVATPKISQTKGDRLSTQSRRVSFVIGKGNTTISPLYGGSPA